MKKLEFKPTDFEFYQNALQRAAKAQMLFDEWFAQEIDGAPVVFGKNAELWTRSEWRPEDTHSARLIDIREIPKKECEHKNVNFSLGNAHGYNKIYCESCDKELRPRNGWEVCE